MSYARKVRWSRRWYNLLYRWFMLRHRLGIPKPDQTASYVPPRGLVSMDVPPPVGTTRTGPPEDYDG